MRKFLAAFLALLLSAAQAFAAAPAIPPAAPTQPVYQWTDGGGNARQSSEAVNPTFDADTDLFTPATSPTDIFILAGSNQYGPSIYLKRIEVSCVSTAAAGVSVRIQTVQGGSNLTTGTYTQLTAANGYISKHDYNDPTSNTNIYYYTANRTSGNGISGSRFLLNSSEMLCSTGSVSSGLATTTAQGAPAIFDFSALRSQTIVQEYGNNYAFAVNLGGASMPSGFAVRVHATWEEIKKPNVCMVGDSTTALATLGYLNGNSSYLGGLGKGGSLNGLANVFNMGSNGFRLSDYLNNLNSPTWPIQLVHGGTPVGNPATTTALQTGNYYSSCDIIVLTYGINDVRTGLMGVDLASMTNRLEALIDTTLYAIANGATLGASYTSSIATSYTVNAASVVTGTATFTGTQSGNTLTAASVTGTIYPGSTVTGGSGSAETIVAYGTGTGGAGTYIASVSQTETSTGSSYASVTFTTSAAHQFSTVGSGETYLNEGVAVTITGSSNTAFNGTYPMQSAPGSTTTFTLTLPTNPGTFSGTASEQFATIWYTSIAQMPQTKTILYSPNSFTTDDFGLSAPLCYLDETTAGSGSSCTAGYSPTWTAAGCVTLAQIAQCASNILYNAYAYFGTNNAGGQDSRVYALVHKQSAGGGPFPSTVTAGNNGGNPYMQNQIHPGSYGQYLEAQQIAPWIVKAASALLTNRY